MIDKLRLEAKKLNILTHPSPPLMQGRDLIKLGLTPSKEFKKILDFAYEAQISEQISNKEEALIFIKPLL